MSKADHYAELVALRRSCRSCAGLTNPADIAQGRFDSDEIGPWSLWQGNLEAKLMVVGQDWGDVASFEKNAGVEAPNNRTNNTLEMLLGLLDVKIGRPELDSGKDVVFFTNAVLCLKNGGLQAKVEPVWFDNCATRFLRRQIEIVNPKVVVGLGESAFRAVLGGFGLKGAKFLAEVESAEGTLLPNGSRALAVYHCGARILNTHRKLAQQCEDWKRIKPYVVER